MSHAVPPEPLSWEAYYRGVVRASFHRPLGRPPSNESQALVDDLSSRVGRKLSGRKDFVEVVLPRFLGEHGLDILRDEAGELEYRWNSFPCDDLVVCSDHAACAAGMQFHETLARTLMPKLRSFRPLEFEGHDRGYCRVLILFNDADPPSDETGGASGDLNPVPRRAGEAEPGDASGSARAAPRDSADG